MKKRKSAIYTANSGDLKIYRNIDIAAMAYGTTTIRSVTRLGPEISEAKQKINQQDGSHIVPA